MSKNEIIGIFCIALGVVGIIFTIGDLILRIGLALCCFMLINYGLRLRKMVSLQMIFTSFITRHRWF